jgi:3-deoxy-D-manno-octulosonate 8-phosphate phosphatase (KDO 8-P phosphatase)
VAVADACAEARAEAHWVTQAGGGRGAVREAVEFILHSQGAWAAVIERYQAERL